MAESRAFTELVSALIRLRQSLDDVSLPLSAPGADQARETRRTTVQQLEDYVLPRLLQIDAPLLAVVGGSTGAGKSTLVNALVGADVTRTGVIRPTTRSPVLVHHPDDAYWFTADRILPDLPRTDGDSSGPALRLVAHPGAPQGLALLDAPDVDSVDQANRELAGALLAAADLWIFVTSALRYADQVPWNVLADAARRSTAVAIVLDRTDPQHAAEVRGHLARMLSARGLKDSPLFSVPESELVDGLLPAVTVEPVRGWLDELASDAAVRGTVVERSLLGTLRSLVYTAHEVADAASKQADAVQVMRADIEALHAEVGGRKVDEVRTGTLLRGPVLARWQELVAGGEPTRWADGRRVALRDRLSSVVRGRQRASTRLEEAEVEAVTAALVEASGQLADEVAARWAESSGGLVDEPDAAARARAARELRARAGAHAAAWQASAVSLVRGAAGWSAADGDRLAGVGATLQVAALGGPDGAAGDAGAGAAVTTRVRAAEEARDVLRRALDTDPEPLVRRLSDELRDRTRASLAADREQRLAVVAALDAEAYHVASIREAARTVDDLRPSGGTT